MEAPPKAPNEREAPRVLDATPTISWLFTHNVMPGMTGRQLSGEAVKQPPDLEVVYTTGNTRNAVVHNGVPDPGVSFPPQAVRAGPARRKTQPGSGMGLSPRPSSQPQAGQAPFRQQAG